MTDEARPSSDEMIRRAREELAAMSRPDAPAPTASAPASPPAPAGDPVPAIRPRRVIRRTGAASPTPTARIAVVVAAALVLLIAGIVFAVVAATVP